MEVNIRCPFRIERDATSVRADPGAVIALLLRCVLSQLSVKRDPAVFENLDARPVSVVGKSRNVQKSMPRKCSKKSISASFIVCQINCISIIEGPDAKYN